MISAGYCREFPGNDLQLDRVPGEVILRISALGLYRAFINGKRVGEDLLTPGWTCYDDRIAYQTYEVSDLLQVGENKIEIWLGDGWYRSQLLWASNPIFNCWGDRVAAIAEIEADGAALLVTDESWKSGFSPVTRNGIYFGEDYDARIVPRAEAGTDLLDFDQRLLVPHEADAVKELAPLTPIDQWQMPKAGTSMISVRMPAPISGSASVARRVHQFVSSTPKSSDRTRSSTTGIIAALGPSCSTSCLAKARKPMLRSLPLWGSAMRG